MSPSANMISGPGGEYVHHWTAVRLRITGTASLKMRLLGLDDIKTYTMLPLPITNTPGRELDRLCNIRSQRTRLELKTTEINEFINVSRILIFTKPSASSLPGNI